MHGESNLKVSTKKRKFWFFGCHNLDIDPMTLVLKLDLHIVVTYYQTKYEVNRSICSKVIVQKQRHTDMCKTFTYPLSWVVIIVTGSITGK